MEPLIFLLLLLLLLLLLFTRPLFPFVLRHDQRSLCLGGWGWVGGGGGAGGGGSGGEEGEDQRCEQEDEAHYRRRQTGVT